MQPFEQAPQAEDLNSINPLLLALMEMHKSEGLTPEESVAELLTAASDIAVGTLTAYRKIPSNLTDDEVTKAKGVIEENLLFGRQLNILASHIEQTGDIQEGFIRFAEEETEIARQQQIQQHSSATEAYFISEVTPDDSEVPGTNEPRISDVVATYAALKNKPGFNLRNRKEISRFIKSAQAKGLSADEFLDSLDGFYSPGDIESLARDKRIRSGIAKVALMIVGGSQAAEALHSSSNSPDTVAVQNVAPAPIVTEKAVTTTEAPTTTTSIPPTPTTTAPPIVYSALQSKLGDWYKFSVNGEPLEVVVQNLSTLLGEPWDVPTLKAYTGIEEPGHVGTIRVIDCPDASSVLIKQGDTLGKIAADNGTTFEAIKALMPDGEPKTIAGGCLPMPPK